MIKLSSKQWYMAKFPESQFLVPQRYQKEYSDRVIKGHEVASKSNILICGIVRDVEAILPYSIARIIRLGNFFKNCHTYIYENDSTDNTKQILHSLDPTHFTVKTENVNPPPFNDPRGINRRTYMAKARNNYLKFAREYTQNNRVHYVAIIDLDVIGGFSFLGTMSSLSYEDYDVIGSNGIFYQQKEDKVVRLFYDTWAYRAYGDPNPIKDEEANLYQFSRSTEIKLVNSCFGGLAIYKPSFLSEGLDYTSEDCDHPTLHNALCNKGYNIYLNPSQITLYNKTEYMNV